MSFDTYADTDISVNNNLSCVSDIEGFEGFEGFEVAGNKQALRKTSKDKYMIRQKLDLINEQRSLDSQLDSFSHYWDFY
jgi:hypothetical protein